jgi:predicted RNase H-like HicB family nuclease
MSAQIQITPIEDQIWREKEYVRIPPTQIPTIPSIAFFSLPSFYEKEIMAIITYQDRLRQRKGRIYLEPQSEGGFVARSIAFEGTIGQGETEEEALRDLNEAIEVLKEFLVKEG